MPKPKEGESKDDFISRCISLVQKEETDLTDKQVAGKCYGIWESNKKDLDLSEITWVVDEAWWSVYGQQSPYSYVHRVYEEYVIVVTSGQYVLVPYTRNGYEVTFDLDSAVLVEHQWVPAERRVRIIRRPIRAEKDDNGLYTCYGVLFGDTDHRDLYGTYFNKSTDFCLDWYSELPWLYHHTHNRHLGARKVGKWVDKGIDDIGVFLKGELTLRNEYLDAVEALLDEQVLFPSTGTLSYAASDPEEDGYIRLWPIVEASSTVAPAEFRQKPISNRAFEAMRMLTRR